MALLEWRDEYLLGVQFLDFEHKDLFERINDLFGTCASHADTEHVADCLGRLHARLSAHFALEEKTMRKLKNPHYAAHKTEHDRFLDEVTDVVAGFGAGFGEADMRQFAERVEQWIVNHITTFDRQLIEGSAAGE